MPKNSSATPRYRCRPASNRRWERRLLCADLIKVRWVDALGARHEEIAVLEGCSISGASLFTGVPIGVGTPITLGGGDEEFQGTVRHSVPAPNGYLAGVTIGELRNYVPEHLLDLSRLIYPEKP